MAKGLRKAVQPRIRDATVVVMEPLNKDRFRYIDGLIRAGRSFSFERSSCIVDGCNNRPIRSHLIPKSWLSLIAREGHVIDINRTLRANSPTTREHQFYEDFFQTVSRPVGVDLASADPVFCSTHDGDKRGVGLLDNQASDLKSTGEQHILFYKAICFSLYECERVLFLLNEIMERRPRDELNRSIYFQSQQIDAHKEFLSTFQQCLNGGCDETCAIGSRLEFKRLFIRGDRVPTLSAIGCGSGLVNCESLFGCRLIGCKFPKSDFMVACKTIESGHVAVIARTRTESLETGICRQANIRHRAPRILSRIFDENPPQGVKLELFVSQELIESSKGFMCSPDRWGRFGTRMKDVAKHHFIEQPSRLQEERKSSFPTEMNGRFNLFRSIE